MPVTIKDVAALAGVSPSTVSRTCKDHPSISRQTKEKVRQAMEQLGYEPNFQASSLATQNSRTIGIILPPSQKEAYENSFYLEVIRGISQFCNQKQYINTVITGQNEEEILAAVKIMAKKGQAEGHIVLYSKEQDPVIDYLYDEGLLYVLIGKAYRNVNRPSMWTMTTYWRAEKPRTTCLGWATAGSPTCPGTTPCSSTRTESPAICCPWRSTRSPSAPICASRRPKYPRNGTWPWKPF